MLNAREIFGLQVKTFIADTSRFLFGKNASARWIDNVRSRSPLSRHFRIEAAGPELRAVDESGQRYDEKDLMSEAYAAMAAGSEPKTQARIYDAQTTLLIMRMAANPGRL